MLWVLCAYNTIPHYTILQHMLDLLHCIPIKSDGAAAHISQIAHTLERFRRNSESARRRAHSHLIPKRNKFIWFHWLSYPAALPLPLTSLSSMSSSSWQSHSPRTSWFYFNRKCHRLLSAAAVGVLTHANANQQSLVARIELSLVRRTSLSNLSRTERIWIYHWQHLHCSLL